MNRNINLLNPFTQDPLEESADGLTANGQVVFPYKNGAYRLVQDDN